MRKVVRLNENDIEKLVKRIINEDLPKKELDRKDTNFRRHEFEPYEREKGVQSIFGKYAEDVPPQVIQYMRKNPAAIIKRLVDVYGLEKVYDYIDIVTEDQPIQEAVKMSKSNFDRHSDIAYIFAHDKTISKEELGKLSNEELKKMCDDINDKGTPFIHQDPKKNTMFDNLALRNKVRK